LYIMIKLMLRKSVRFYVLFIFICFVVLSLFYTVSRLDYINMTNNGFVHKDAITFTMDKLDKPFRKTSEAFLLFQYEYHLPRNKTVWINGNHPLPAISFNQKNHISDITNHSRNIAIAGKDAATKDFPSDYEIIGHFEPTTSYRLNSEVWLLPAAFQIDLAQGHYFVFNTTAHNKLDALHNIINGNSIELIDSEQHGTYALNSNRFLLMGMRLFFALLVAVFLLICVVWLHREKHIINIMYTSGFTPLYIYGVLVRYKVVPCVGGGIIALLLAKTIQNHLYPTWGSRWIEHSIITISSFVLFLIVQCLVMVLIYSIRKGGRRY